MTGSGSDSALPVETDAVRFAQATVREFHLEQSRKSCGKRRATSSLARIGMASSPRRPCSNERMRLLDLDCPKVDSLINYREQPSRRIFRTAPTISASETSFEQLTSGGRRSLASLGEPGLP